MVKLVIGGDKMTTKVELVGGKIAFIDGMPPHEVAQYMNKGIKTKAIKARLGDNTAIIINATNILYIIE